MPVDNGHSSDVTLIAPIDNLWRAVSITYDRPGRSVPTRSAN